MKISRKYVRLSPIDYYTSPRIRGWSLNPVFFLPAHPLFHASTWGILFTNNFNPNESLFYSQNQMKTYDQLFNDHTFVLCATNSYRFIACVCALYFEVSVFMAIKVRMAAEAITMIMLTCYVSNVVHRQYSNLLGKIESLELGRSLQVIDHLLINRMYSMKNDLCFTAFDLYKINAKTIFSLFSLIITYSVIFIQTQ